MVFIMSSQDYTCVSWIFVFIGNGGDNDNTSGYEIIMENESVGIQFHTYINVQSFTRAHTHTHTHINTHTHTHTPNFVHIKLSAGCIFMKQNRHSALKLPYGTKV